MSLGYQLEAINISKILPNLRRINPMNNFVEFNASDPELNKRRKHARKFCHAINTSLDGKVDLCRQLFNSIGNNFEIWGSFFCEFGNNITVGDNVFFNTNCVLLDAFEISIGNNVFIGPGVGIYTSNHDMDYEKRRNYIEFGMPIVIEDDVWIGGNAVILPGVRIGYGSVIGAGAIVSKSIPPKSRVIGSFVNVSGIESR